MLRRNESRIGGVLRALLGSTVCILTLSATPQANAQAPFLTAGGTQVFSTNAIVGYDFTTSIFHVRISALAWYDLPSNGGSVGDGLGTAHQVGIWSEAGHLLRSVTIPAGDVATLEGGYRFVALDSPLYLLPQTTYIIGGNTRGPNGETGDTAFALLPITAQSTFTPHDYYVNNGRSLVGEFTDLMVPTDTDFANLYAMPNMTWERVPAPTTTTLFGLAALCAARRRR